MDVIWCFCVGENNNESSKKNRKKRVRDYSLKQKLLFLKIDFNLHVFGNVNSHDATQCSVI